MSPWSTDVRVECVGVAADAVTLNPRRVRHHATPDIAAEIIADAVAMIDRSRDAGLDISTGRATLLEDPIWDSRVLLLDAAQRTDLTDLEDRLADRGRG